jgi:CheY-specific phosphatase CheX
VDLQRQELLEATLITVLEQFAFLFADLVEKDEIEVEESEFAMVSLSFTGDFSGQLVLATPSSSCVEIAANVLGTDPSNPKAQEDAQDAMQELANVCCGHILTAIAGDEPVFDLGVPSFGILSLEEWNSLYQDPETLVFIVEDFPLLLRWTDTRAS